MQEHDCAGEAAELGHAPLALFFGHDCASVALFQEDFIRLVERVVALGLVIQRAGMVIIPRGRERKMFVQENLAVERGAVAGAHGIALPVDLELPPVPRTEAHGGGLGHGELALQDRQAVGTHQKHIVIADPGDLPVPRNGLDEDVPLGCGVEIEERQHERAGKFLRLQSARAVKDHDVRCVSDRFARKAMPYRHHGRQNVHRAEGGLVALRQRFPGNAQSERGQKRSEGKAHAVRAENVFQELGVIACYGRRG